MRRQVRVFLLAGVFAAGLSVSLVNAAHPPPPAMDWVTQASRPTLRRGDRGPAVSELQRRLNIWIAVTPTVKLRSLAISSLFAAQTEAAVKVFQKAKGLPVTGVVGARTWALLPPVRTVRSGIRDFLFRPEPLTIRIGTTVVWTNKDVAPHTVTHGTYVKRGGAFDSGTLRQGQSFAFTFNRAGNYTYSCLIHPEMVGTVKVVSP